MKFDLKALTRKELEKLRGDIEKALDKIADVEKKAALAAAEKAARAYGYSLVELTGETAEGTTTPAKAPKARKPKTPNDGRAKVAPKYRNPENPEQTWSGRGRSPKWVEAYLAAGGSLENITI